MKGAAFSMPSVSTTSTWLRSGLGAPSSSAEVIMAPPIPVPPCGPIRAVSLIAALLSSLPAMVSWVPAAMVVIGM